jgi:hypothetical protein
MICVILTSKSNVVVNDFGLLYFRMKRKQWLIFRILDLLAMIENKKNQPIVNQIKGLLYELLDS